MLKTAIRLAGITALLASGLVSEANAVELKVMVGEAEAFLHAEWLGLDAGDLRG